MTTAMEQLSPQLMNRLVFAVIMHGLNDSQTKLALSVLTDALNNDNANIRELAVVALADLSVAPEKRVPALALALRDEQAKVRRRAARALGDQGVASVAAFAELKQGLNDPDLSVRRDCAGALGRLGPAAGRAAPALVAMLRETEYRTRAVVAVSLKRLGRGAIPALLDGVRSECSTLRGRCATLLGRIAPDDADVADVLQRVLTDSDSEVRARADEALQLICTPPPIPLAV